jgi:hypothetical protein
MPPDCELAATRSANFIPRTPSRTPGVVMLRLRDGFGVDWPVRYADIAALLNPIKGFVVIERNRCTVGISLKCALQLLE